MIYLFHVLGVKAVKDMPYKGYCNYPVSIKHLSLTPSTTHFLYKLYLKLTR
jgi:hypothetical protein